ncbi:hypothetical protein [Streptomyces sp. NPDC005799]|uniref:hypothetical protein n=1 Tax=Streptomyces sp. NPDC005799 TaxID=3154678 RepID=UPI0033E158D3
MAIYDQEPEEGAEFDMADEVSLQDTGRPYGWAARIIRHPSMAPTRRYLDAHPLPEQKTRRTA